MRTRRRRRLFGLRNAGWVLRGGGGDVFGFWNLLAFSLWIRGERWEGKGKRRGGQRTFEAGEFGVCWFLFLFLRRVLCWCWGLFRHVDTHA